MLTDRKCSNCEHEELDLIEKSSDPENILCPVCNKPTFKKKLSVSSFNIAGYSYKTGYE